MGSIALRQGDESMSWAEEVLCDRWARVDTPGRPIRRRYKDVFVVWGWIEKHHGIRWPANESWIDVVAMAAKYVQVG